MKPADPFLDIEKCDFVKINTPNGRHEDESGDESDDVYLSHSGKNRVS